MKDIKSIKNHSFIDNLEKDSNIIDLGTFKGGFIEGLIKRGFSFGKAILVEANPMFYAKLNDKFNKNNVYVLNKVIANKNGGSSKFYVNQDYLQASSVYEEFGSIKNVSSGNEGKVEIKYKNVNRENIYGVENITLEKILSDFNINKVGLLKIDVEGSEWDLLESITKKELDKIQQISVEFHDFMNNDYRERTERCIKKLKKEGFNFIKFTHNKKRPYHDCLFYK